MLRLFLSIVLFSTSSAFANPTFTLKIRNAIKIGVKAHSNDICYYNDASFRERIVEFTPKNQYGQGIIKSDVVEIELEKSNDHQTYKAMVKYHVALFDGGDSGFLNQTVEANNEEIYIGNSLFSSASDLARSGSFNATNIGKHSNGCNVLVYSWIVPQ